jgi:cytochrome P450
MSSVRKYDLYSREFRQNSHAVFAQMRAGDPVFKQIGLDGKTLIWFVTRYDEAQRVLLDDLHFVRDPSLLYNEEERQRIFGTIDPQIERMMNNHMLNKDGEHHRRLRSRVSKAFTPKVIQNIRPRIEAIAGELLDKVEAGAEWNWSRISHFPCPLP